MGNFSPAIRICLRPSMSILLFGPGSPSAVLWRCRGILTQRLVRGCARSRCKLFWGRNLGYKDCTIATGHNIFVLDEGDGQLLGDLEGLPLFGEVSAHLQEEAVETVETQVIETDGVGRGVLPE